MLSIVCQFVSGQHEEASGMTILDGGRAHRHLRELESVAWINHG